MGITTHTLYLCLLLPLPIVSIKLGYNGREECESDTRICSKPVEDGQGSRPVEHL